MKKERKKGREKNSKDKDEKMTQTRVSQLRAATELKMIRFEGIRVWL